MAVQTESLPCAGAVRTGIPAHVAIIMDGNGRWARERGLPRLAGHRAGTNRIREVLSAAVELGIQVLTLYTFSTENWQRPRGEVEGLLRILADTIDRETAALHDTGVRICHLGSLESLPPGLRKKVLGAVALTHENSKIILNVAFNYGGRAEIVQAARRLIADGVPAHAVTEELLSSHMYTAGLPDPDLIIRTAGEMRLSNFLLWQSAYSEYWSTPVYWPDFGKEHLGQAVAEFRRRRRRFGGL